MEKPTSTVQKKGQVTLPLEMRRNLGIEPGDEVAFEQVTEGILVKIQKDTRAARLNQLLQEMNQILQEVEGKRGRRYSLEELIEGARGKRGEILKEKYGLDDEDD